MQLVKRERKSERQIELNENESQRVSDFRDTVSLECEQRAPTQYTLFNYAFGSSSFTKCFTFQLVAEWKKSTSND